MAVTIESRLDAIEKNQAEMKQDIDDLNVGIVEIADALKYIQEQVRKVSTSVAQSGIATANANNALELSGEVRDAYTKNFKQYELFMMKTVDNLRNIRQDITTLQRKG
jgi:uncharacterized coiled-coil protein SlyX